MQLPGLGRAQATLQAHRFPGGLRAGACRRVPQQAQRSPAGGGGGLSPLFLVAGITDDSSKLPHSFRLRRCSSAWKQCSCYLNPVVYLGFGVPAQRKTRPCACVTSFVCSTPADLLPQNVLVGLLFYGLQLFSLPYSPLRGRMHKPRTTARLKR